VEVVVKKCAASIKGSSAFIYVWRGCVVWLPYLLFDTFFTFFDRGKTKERGTL
jgi:hypothetical protein